MRVRDESLWLEDVIAISGRQRGPFVMGPSWILEWARIEAGSIVFFHGGEPVQPRTRCFGTFLAPFSVTEMGFEDYRASWVGLASSGPPPFPGPVLLEVDSLERPEDPGALLAAAEGAQSVRPIDRAPSPSRLSSRLKSLLDEKYRETIPIARIAREFDVTHAHLSRVFKKDYGVGPVAYRHRLRAQDAVGRLARGEPIVEVAHAVGYNDLGRFYRAFRSANGASPGRCKVKNRQDKTRPTN